MINQRRRNFLKWGLATTAGLVAASVPRILQKKEQGLEHLADSLDKAQEYLDDFHSRNSSPFIESLVVMPKGDYNDLASEFKRAFAEYYVDQARDAYLSSSNTTTLEGLVDRLRQNTYARGIPARYITREITDRIAWESTEDYKSIIIKNYQERKKANNPIKRRNLALAPFKEGEFWALPDYKTALQESRTMLEYEEGSPDLSIPRLENKKEDLLWILHTYFSRFNDAGFALLPTNMDATRFVAFVSPEIFRQQNLDIFYRPTGTINMDIDGAIRHIYAVAGKMAASERLLDWTAPSVGEDLTANGIENLAERDSQLSEYGKAMNAASPITLRANAVQNALSGFSPDVEKGFYDPNRSIALNAAHEFAKSFSQHYIKSVQSGQYSKADLERLVENHLFFRSDPEGFRKTLQRASLEYLEVIISNQIKEELTDSIRRSSAIFVQTPESLGKTPKFSAYAFREAFDPIGRGYGGKMPSQRYAEVNLIPMLRKEYESALKRAASWLQKN